MRLDELDKKITQSDIDALETFADRIFGKVGIDVEFTRHFLDRVNDDRNGEQITGSELTRLFKQEYKRWGKPIAQMGPDQEAVMKDLQTDINMPFALRWDKDNNELDLIVKTVMRKKDFKTSNKEFPVESIEESPSVMSSQQMLTKLSKEMQGTHTGTSNPNSDWSKFVLSHKGFTLKDVQVDQIPTAVNSDGMSQANIEQYKQADLSKFPPMVIGNDGYILDGNHRLQAYKAQGIKTVKAYIGESETEDCTGCNGTGWERVSSDEDERACDDCGGTGKVNNETVNEESGIYKWNKEDPNNPEVLIQGYGRLMLNQIEDSVVRKLEELTKMAKRGDFEQIQHLLDRDVMQTMMKAIVDTKAELQATRRRGGPKSRGINKESILSNTLEDELADKFDEVKKSVTEYGVGKIVPGINTTVDVGPNEIKKQAAKFGNKVSKDGLPKKTFRRK